MCWSSRIALLPAINIATIVEITNAVSDQVTPQLKTYLNITCKHPVSKATDVKKIIRYSSILKTTLSNFDKKKKLFFCVLFFFFIFYNNKKINFLLLIVKENSFINYLLLFL